MRILIAEDDLISRTVLLGVLEKDGHEVIVTENGAEAWVALQQSDAPPLAILDRMMPEMSGLDVVRRVRARTTEMPPYLIILTSKGEKIDIVAGLEAGANDYLAKPFNPGELRARVEVGRRMYELQAALAAKIEALYKAEDEIRRMAFTDPLTRLPNRRLLDDRLNQALTTSDRHGRYAALIMFDLDNFKSLNDTHGHDIGDKLLIEVAARVCRCVREGDTVARLGGDEFVVILGELPSGEAESMAGAGRVAEKIRAALAAPYHFSIQRGEVVSDCEHRGSASMGVALFSGSQITAEDLQKRADIAMYQAKKTGRNRVCFYDGNTGADGAKLSLASSLK